MISNEEVQLVQSSWKKVAPISETAADLFYGKLFELDPSVKPMFPDDMAEQKKKLMQTLAVCVNGLDDLEQILPAVEALGKRHLDYKVEDAHYETVGAALLWTLEQGLGDEFTAETREAWTKVYTALAATMKQGAAAVSTEQ